MPRRADVVCLQCKFGHQFALHTQIVVINVRVADAFREYDSGELGQIGVSRIPTCQIANGLRSVPWFGLVAGPVNVGAVTVSGWHVGVQV